MADRSLLNTASDKAVAGLRVATGPLRRIWAKFSDAVLGLFAILVVAFSLLTYSPDVARAASSLFSSNKYLALVDGLFNPMRNRHLLLKSGMPIYDLKIKRSEMAKVEEVIEQAKKQGWMSDDLKVWVRANFIYDGREYGVNVRVRGDLSNHWRDPKKSWAIKFGKEKIEDDGELTKQTIPFQTKRRINLIIPSDRD